MFIEFDNTILNAEDIELIQRPKFDEITLITRRIGGRWHAFKETFETLTAAERRWEEIKKHLKISIVSNDANDTDELVTFS